VRPAESHSAGFREAFELPHEARILSLPLGTAGVAELADALDSKSSDRKIVWVRAPPPAIGTSATDGRTIAASFFFFECYEFPKRHLVNVPCAFASYNCLPQ
jgi:hypothetical protein